MNENRKKSLQKQLRQFLKEYRNKKNCTAEVAADNINVEIATYRTLEGNKPNNRVISSLEYLNKIAKLNELSLTAFISFLELSPRTSNGSNLMKRKLYNWEKELLQYFDFVGIPLRNSFLKKLNKKEPADLKNALSCLDQIISLDIEKQNALFSLVREFSKK